MKILAFGATTSSTSINRKLANVAARLVPDADVTDLDLRDYQLPIYSSDLEASNGMPADAQRFIDAIKGHDAIVVSLAEHNGSYTAAYKNLYDWASRIDPKVYQNKPTVMLSTSPGARGGAGVLAAAVNSAPFFGADLRASMSVPSFYDNFDAEKQRLRDGDLLETLRATLSF